MTTKPIAGIKESVGNGEQQAINSQTLGVLGQSLTGHSAKGGSGVLLSTLPYYLLRKATIALSGPE